MKILTTLICAFLVTASTLQAEGKRTLGVVTAIAGAGMVVGAFNYKKTCDDGYRSVYETGFRAEYATYDYCTTFAGNTVTTRETPVDISLKRPKLLYSGIGAVIGGVLLATVFRGAPALKDVTLGVGPGELRVQKAFSF